MSEFYENTQINTNIHIRGDIILDEDGIWENKD